MLYDGYELNRLVFKDTREKSNTIFSKATKDAIKKSVVIKNPEKIRIGKRTKQHMEIEFFFQNPQMIYLWKEASRVKITSLSIFQKTNGLSLSILQIENQWKLWKKAGPSQM